MLENDLLNQLHRVIDEREIEKVLTQWMFARDSGEWEILANCFQPDATINISWFSGTAVEFVNKSKDMVTEFKPGEHGKHLLGHARIVIENNRAVSECHVELVRRVVTEPFNFDTITWGRFFDLFEKRADGIWRIFCRTMVYEKDRLDAVNPSNVPAGFFESMDLSQYPTACQFLCYRLSLNGRVPMENIIETGSINEIQLKNEAGKWLNNSITL